MESLKPYYDRALAEWAKLPVRGRIAIGVVAALGLVIALAVAFAGGEPKRVLFSGVDPADAAAIVRALDAAKIEYELDSGGTLIRVDASKVDSARILLAEQDLPKSGNVGFEIFEQQSFGLTEFAQEVNYRRALQGELERTIAEIEAVASARVHVTQPRKSVFEDEKVPATASVTLKLVAGRTLSDRSVGAMRHLVASAVEGLEAEQVTVLDTKGNLLSRSAIGSDETAASLDYETDLERDLERKIARLLERTVGVGGAEVRVAAEVDFSRTDTTEEVFDPEQTVVRNESTQEILENSAPRPRGIAGAQANGPGAAEAANPAGGTDSSRITRSKTYEVNRTVVRTVGSGVNLKRLTVAVLVDGTYTIPEDGGDPVFNPIPDDELAALKGIVETAMGYDAARGDRIQISSVPFRDRVGRPGDDKVGELKSSSWVPYAIGGAALLLLAIPAVVLARRRRRSTALVPEVLSLPMSVRQAQDALDRKGSPNALPDGQIRAALPPGTPVPATREDIQTLAKTDPERAADIIRAWIAADHAS